MPQHVKRSHLIKVLLVHSQKFWSFLAYDGGRSPDIVKKSKLTECIPFWHLTHDLSCKEVDGGREGQEGGRGEGEGGGGGGGGGGEVSCSLCQLDFILPKLKCTETFHTMIKPKVKHAKNHSHRFVLFAGIFVFLYSLHYYCAWHNEIERYTDMPCRIYRTKNVFRASDFSVCRFRYLLMGVFQRAHWAWERSIYWIAHADLR